MPTVADPYESLIRQTDGLIDALREPEQGPYDASAVQALRGQLETSIAVDESADPPSQAAEFVKSAARGLSGGITDLPKGVAFALSEIENLAAHTIGIGRKDRALEDYLLYQLGERVDRFVDESIPLDPRLQDSFWLSTLPEGIGSAASFMVGGLAGKALKAGRVAKVAKTAAELTPIAVQGALVGAPQQYEEARDFDANIGTAKSAGRWGALFGTTEVLGVPAKALRLLDRVDDASGGTMRRQLTHLITSGLVNTAEEAAQEVGQTVGQNWVAKAYDKERELIDGVLKAGAAGGIIGALFTGIFGGLALRRSRTAQARLLSTEQTVPPTEQPTAAPGEPGGPEGPPAQMDATGVLRDPERFVEAFPLDARSIAASIDPNAKTGLKGPEFGFYPPQDVFDQAGLTGTNRKQRRRIAQGVRSALEKRDAGTVREDQRLVEAEGSELEGGKDAGGKDIQLDEEAGRGPGDRAAQEPGEEADVLTPPTPPSEPEGQPEKEPTSIKNAVVDREREKRGLRPAMQAAKQSFQDFWDEAMRIIESNPARQDALIEELKTTPKAVGPVEDALLLHRQIDLQNQYDKVVAEMETADEAKIAELQPVEELLSAKLLELYDINKAVGTATGRGLAARKMLAAEDFTLAKMLAQKRKAKGVAALSSDDTAAVKKAQREIADLQKKLDDYVAKIEQLESEKALAATVAAVQAKAKRRPRATKAKADIESAWKDFESKYSGTLFANPVPVIADLAKIAHAYIKLGVATVQDFLAEATKRLGAERAKKLDSELREAWTTAIAESKPTPRTELKESSEIGQFARKLAEYFVSLGVTERDPLIDAVHKELSGVLPDITRRQTMDAISGYGEFTQLSKDEIKVKLRDLKGQMQQVAKLEDMQAGQAPLKTGPERRTPSDAERRLIQQVNEAKKRGGFTVTDPARQLKSALDAIKTRLRHEIADLTQQIATRQRIVKDRKAPPRDDAVDRLIKQRDELRKDFDEIFGKRERTDEQKIATALKAVERSIAEYERRIKEKDFGPFKRISKTPTSAALKAAKSQRAALKDEFQHLKDLANPKKTPEERALSAYKASLTRRKADYEARLAAGDFAPKARKATKLDAEAERMRFETEKAKAAFLRGLEADRRKRRSFSRKAAELTGDVLFNVTRAVMFGPEFSMVGLQGGARLFGHPIKTGRAFGRGLESLVSASAAFREMHKLRERPNFKSGKYQRWGVQFTEVHGPLHQQEEAFMSTVVDKIPILKQFARMWPVFMNRLRADYVDEMTAGRPVTDEQGKVLADFANIATGRGHFGRLNGALALLNAVYLAPRYVVSRFQLLTMYPLLRGGLSTKAAIAKEYARTLAGIGATVGLTNLALRAFMGPPGDDKKWDMELNPLDPDFGIRIGSRRIDPFFGLRQATVFLSRMGATAYSRLVHGKPAKEVQHPGFTIENFKRNKLAPIPASVTSLLLGDMPGTTKFHKILATPENVALNLITPVTYEDIYQSMRADGVPAEKALGLLNIFGIGVRSPPQYTNEELGKIAKAITVVSEKRRDDEPQADYELRVERSKDNVEQAVSLLRQLGITEQQAVEAFMAEKRRKGEKATNAQVQLIRQRF